MPLEKSACKTVLSDNVVDSKVVKDVHVSPKTASIEQNLSVGFGTLIFDKAHMSSNSTSHDLTEIVKPNIPTVPSKSIKFSHPECDFMVVPMK